MKKCLLLILFFYSSLLANLSITIKNDLDDNLFLAFPKFNNLEKGFFVNGKKSLKININTKKQKIDDIIPKFYISKNHKIYTLNFMSDFPLFIADQDKLVFDYVESEKAYRLILNDELYYFCLNLKKIKNKYLWLNYLNKPINLKYSIGLDIFDINLPSNNFILFDFCKAIILNINQFLIELGLPLKFSGSYYFGCGEIKKENSCLEYYKINYGDQCLSLSTGKSFTSFHINDKRLFLPPFYLSEKYYYPLEDRILKKLNKL